MIVRVTHEGKQLIVNCNPNPIIPGVRLVTVKEVLSEQRRKVVTDKYKGTSQGQSLATTITKFTHDDKGRK